MTYATKNNKTMSFQNKHFIFSKGMLCKRLCFAYHLKTDHTCHAAKRESGITVVDAKGISYSFKFMFRCCCNVNKGYKAGGKFTENGKEFSVSRHFPKMVRRASLESYTIISICFEVFKIETVYHCSCLGRIHPAIAHFCECETEAETLVRQCFWPGSPRQTKIAFSFQFLDTMISFLLSCHVSKKGFLAAMQHLHHFNDYQVHIYLIMYRYYVTYDDTHFVLS